MVSEQTSRKRKKFEELPEQRKRMRRAEGADRTARSKLFAKEKGTLEYEQLPDDQKEVFLETVWEEEDGKRYKKGISGNAIW